jgi:hypothetical protein
MNLCFGVAAVVMLKLLAMGKKPDIDMREAAIKCIDAALASNGEYSEEMAIDALASEGKIGRA